jgi:hypothetical protein
MTDTNLISLLSPHGKGKNMAQWVVDNFQNRTDYNPTVERWVEASQQILDTEEKLGLAE